MKRSLFGMVAVVCSALVLIGLGRYLLRSDHDTAQTIPYHRGAHPPLVASSAKMTSDLPLPSTTVRTSYRPNRRSSYTYHVHNNKLSTMQSKKLSNNQQHTTSTPFTTMQSSRNINSYSSGGASYLTNQYSSTTSSRNITSYSSSVGGHIGYTPASTPSAIGGDAYNDFNQDMLRMSLIANNGLGQAAMTKATITSTSSSRGAYAGIGRRKAPGSIEDNYNDWLEAYRAWLGAQGYAQDDWSHLDEWWATTVWGMGMGDQPDLLDDFYNWANPPAPIGDGCVWSLALSLLYFTIKKRQYRQNIIC